MESMPISSNKKIRYWNRDEKYMLQYRRDEPGQEYGTVSHCSHARPCVSWPVAERDALEGDYKALEYGVEGRATVAFGRRRQTFDLRAGTEL